MEEVDTYLKPFLNFLVTWLVVGKRVYKFLRNKLIEVKIEQCNICYW